MKYLVFGSINIDRTYSVPHFVREGETMSASGMELFCGGKGFNQAVALARAGKEVYMAGAVGTDGDMLLKALEADGVCCRYLKRTNGVSGHAVIQVESGGQNSIIILPGANGEITEEDVDGVLSHFEAGDVIVLQNEITCVAYILRKAWEKGMLVALNPSPCDARIRTYDMRYVNYLLVNEVEAEAISGCAEPNAMADALQKAYPNMNLVLTMGVRGSMFRGADGSRCAVGIYPTNAVDTTAAGDTFAGFFLASMTEDGDCLKALRRGAIASGISVSRKGASASIPRLREVQQVRLDSVGDFR